MSRQPKEKNSLTLLDKRILKRLQRDIPFIDRPWRRIAGEIGIDESVLIRRIIFLKKRGIIRRISATFNPGKVGFTSMLVALKTAPEKIERVAGRVNSYDEVTHNYKRKAEYNLWFTLVAPGRGRISEILRRIKKDKDVQRMLELPARRLFKIEVNFKI